MRSLAVLLAVVAAAPLAAQTDESTWTFSDARGGFCIWYLADPAQVGDLAPKGVTLRVAGTDASELPPSLSRVIQDEPQFASWIPGTICIGFYGSAAVDGRETVTAKDGETILVMTHSLAATSPRGVPGADHFLIELGTDRGSLARAAERAGVRTSDRSVDVSKVPDTDDEEVVIKLGKTRIHWQGRPTGDARVEWTRSMSFGYAGQRLSTWRVTFDAAPQQVFAMVGALRVEGKDDLGKVLRASPIRAVGPIERGGSATLTFTRAGGR